MKRRKRSQLVLVLRFEYGIIDVDELGSLFVRLPFLILLYGLSRGIRTLQDILFQHHHVTACLARLAASIYIA